MFSGFLMLLATALHANDIITPQQEMIDRLQEEQQRREERRRLEQFVPAPETGSQNPVIPETGPCFVLEQVQISFPGAESPAIHHLAEDHVASLPGQCLGAQGIQQLLQQINASLTSAGFVTSRALLPEQNMAQGTLEIVLVPGHVEKVRTDDVPARTVRLALPVRRDRLLNLRDMEQAIENLNRVRGMNASFDIEPGSDSGTSVLVLGAEPSRPYGANALVSSKLYDDTPHSNLMLSGEWGSPLGLTDKLLASLNTVLDSNVSDRSWGLSFDYEIGIRYWLLAASYSHQQYLNYVPGIFERYESTGSTDTTRLEAMRVLHRSAGTRISGRVNAEMNFILNELEGAQIHVSSYELARYGIGMDASHVVGFWQVGGSLNAYYAEAYGAATKLPGGGSIGDTHTAIAAYSLFASRGIGWQRGLFSLRLNGQLTDDFLFPMQQYSLASRVRGFDGLSVTGHGGHTLTLELATSHVNGGWQWRPFVAVDAGIRPAISDDNESAKLAALIAGTGLSRSAWQARLELATALRGVSTVAPVSGHVLSGSLSYVF